jgi:hypothetical protein
MISSFRGPLTRFLYVLVMAGVSITAGCAGNSQAVKGAAEGAATGAVAGAVSGMLSALVFGGDIADAGARGAVYGGTTGAVRGGMAGSRADRDIAARKQAEYEAELKRFRAEIGADAYNGIIALAECKHEIAIANAREAAKSNISDHVLAGVWVEALTEADRQNDLATRAIFPELIKRDGEVKTEADAEALLNEALRELGDIRVESNLPADC